jgi:hypothetical protein
MPKGRAPLEPPSGATGGLAPRPRNPDDFPLSFTQHLDWD